MEGAGVKTGLAGSDCLGDGAGLGAGAFAGLEGSLLDLDFAEGLGGMADGLSMRTSCGDGRMTGFGEGSMTGLDGTNTGLIAGAGLEGAGAFAFEMTMGLGAGCAGAFAFEMTAGFCTEGLGALSMEDGTSS